MVRKWPYLQMPAFSAAPKLHLPKLKNMISSKDILEYIRAELATKVANNAFWDLASTFSLENRRKCNPNNN
jgi:hypothetical protein